jgi:hypothetical protein
MALSAAILPRSYSARPVSLIASETLVMEAATWASSSCVRRRPGPSARRDQISWLVRQERRDVRARFAPHRLKGGFGVIPKVLQEVHESVQIDRPAIRPSRREVGECGGPVRDAVEPPRGAPDSRAAPIRFLSKS